jgi:glycosyltransferase involved in cell wall biosynthesis
LPSHRISALNSAESVRLLPIEWPRGCWQRTFSALCRRLGRGQAFDWVHLLRVKKLKRILRADHILYPWFLGEPVPLEDKLPWSILVLDRNWARFPENFAQSPQALDTLLELWLRRAKNVIAISNEVANELRLIWPELSRKIATVPLAASVQTNQRALPLAAEPCFYYPATVSPHKGHAILLEAAERVAAGGLRFRLILSGHGTDTLVNHVRIDLVKTGFIEALGYTDLQTVERCYLRAWAVVLPSLYEGFGLPLAEAIAHGTFVICSDLPTYREQIERLDAGAFAQVVPVGDPVALADAMAARIARGRPTPEERASIARAGDHWTWRDVAKGYNAVLCGLNS